MTAPVKGFREGDVLRYTPEGGTHCREGHAIVEANGRAIDTYWGFSGGDRHVLSAAELEAATRFFNLGDYREVSEEEWLTYALDDRGFVSSQHGLQPTYVVRSGAEPDLATQIENARGAVRFAESERDAADRRLWRRREELAALLSKRGGS